MNGGPLARIQDAFGWDGFPHALFYHARYALRFELDNDAQGAPVQLIRAMDRARLIASDAFAESVTLTAVISYYSDRKTARRVSAAFDRLAKIGFRESLRGSDRVPRNDEDHIAAFGVDLYRCWHGADFDKSDDAMTALLWAALTRDLSITPSTRCFSVHIVDFARKIVVHPYDDRGLDVVAPDRQTLRPLYERRNDWLLDHDRKAMDATFG
ncbi:DUF3885 domain-containing protein [Methylobacterium aquaticum]|uniref:DUF3885 domain-containing protein n=1 Tax=Methylobacterium aquaticum TaxID=270351 RepID=A0A0J6UQG8_9HYPH|nr:DUF3885 domain-containing protein [Methylobacterium aquaticum]KMO28301.1 hypothetical protein VP06_27995 [Methylobacterium aquaticum]